MWRISEKLLPVSISFSGVTDGSETRFRWYPFKYWRQGFHFATFVETVHDAMARRIRRRSGALGLA